MIRRYIESLYRRCGSIRTMLRLSYNTIILAMILPTLILLSSVLVTTTQYNRQIRNIEQASGIRAIVSEELPGEVWYIVSGRIQYGSGRQFEILAEIVKRLDAIESTSGHSAQYLDAARQSVLTLESYLHRLGELIEADSLVRYKEEAYRDVVSVSRLTDQVLGQFIEEEIAATARFNTGIQRVTAVVFLLVVLLFALVFVFASNSVERLRRSIHQPILSLERMATAITEGDLSARVPASEVEELRPLTDRLNVMAGSLRELIDERVQVREELQRAELRALQEQITPHFLYNTFESIIWLAEEERSREVVEVTIAFTDFFRTSLSQGKDFITVATEEQHVTSYLLIQSVRYGSVMTYDIDIDPVLRDCLILKLLLQPLVENAIYHGIKPGRRRGHIQVTGRPEQGDRMTFTVSDNGMGMTPERLGELRERLARVRPGETGFGLYNVNRRIRVFYGGEGLRFDSEHGRGTRVSFTLPRHKEVPG